MKLNKAQKRVLIVMPIVILCAGGLFALAAKGAGGGNEEITKAFWSGAISCFAGALFSITSVFFNWPWKLKDDD